MKAGKVLVAAALGVGAAILARYVSEKIAPPKSTTGLTVHGIVATSAGALTAATVAAVWR